MKVPEAVRLTANDDDCFDGARWSSSAIPTQYMRSVWKRLRRTCRTGVPIVSVAKGIENDTLLRPTQVIADVLCGRGVARAACERDSSCCPGRTSPARSRATCPAPPSRRATTMRLATRVQAAFATQWFRVYTNNDAIGVELAGATKNVIAIAAGILDGLAAGNNAKAALVTRGLVEITRLGVAMGAQEATFHGLAGLGDLITTCVSPEGRNRTVGEQIGKGRKLDDVLGEMDSVAEGVPTTQAVHAARPAIQRRDADHRSGPRGAVRGQGRAHRADRPDDPRTQARACTTP